MVIKFYIPCYVLLAPRVKKHLRELSKFKLSVAIISTVLSLVKVQTSEYLLKITVFIFSIQFQLLLTVIMSLLQLYNWENQVILLVVYGYVSQMINGFMKILKQEQKLLLNNKKLPVQKPVAFCLVCEIF